MPRGAAALVLVRRAVGALLLASVVGFFVVGEGSARRPTLVPAGAVVAAPGFGGFAEAGFTVVASGGESPGRAHCAVLASATATRSAGLAGRRGLGGYAAVLFTFPAPTSVAFSMAHTTIPVTLAWLDAAGRYLGQVDMIPCPGGLGCPSYYSTAPFSSAIEVPLGGLATLGIGPGATIHAIGPCIG